MNLSWVLPRSWRRRRPAAQPQAGPPRQPEPEQPQRREAEQPQGNSGLPPWRRLPVLTVTVNGHRPVTGDGRAAVAGTRSLVARPAGRPARPLVRGRSDGLVTASPPRRPEERTPVTAETEATGAGVSADAVSSGDAALSEDAVSTGGAVASGGEGAPAVTAYPAAPVARAAPRRLPAVPEAPDESRPRADLTRATAESVGLPRPVTPPPPRSEFAQRLDAFRPEWLRAEMEGDLPHYVRARAAETARSDDPGADAPSAPPMPRPGGDFSPPGRFRPVPAGPAGTRMPSGAAAGPDRPDAGAVSRGRPPAVFRRTVHRGAGGAPRPGSGTSGTAPSAEQPRGEDAPEGDGATPSGRSSPDIRPRTRESAPDPSSEAAAVHEESRPPRHDGEHARPVAGPAAARSVQRPAETAGPVTGDARATADREGARAPESSSPVRGPAAGEASGAPGVPRGSAGSREGGAGGPGGQEVSGASRVMRHVATSGRPSSDAQDTEDSASRGPGQRQEPGPADAVSAPASASDSRQAADDRAEPAPASMPPAAPALSPPPPSLAPFAAARPGRPSAPDTAPADASAHVPSARVPSEDGEFAAPDTSRRPVGSGAADGYTAAPEPSAPQPPRKPQRDTAGGQLPSAVARPSRPTVRPRPSTAATTADAPGAPPGPPAAPAHAAAVPGHPAPAASPRHRLATTGADDPAPDPIAHTAADGHGPATSPTAAVPHAARPARSAKAASVAVLAPHLAHRFERELGMPVSGVVVRRDAEATVRARRLGARAFTENGTVFLPETVGPLDGPDGQALLAHELVHAVQQATRPVTTRATGEEDSVMEAEAVTAERWARGHPVPLRHPRPAAAPPPPPTAAEQAGDVVQRAPLAASPSVGAAAPPEDPRPAGHDHMPVTDAVRAARYPDPGAEHPVQGPGARYADGSLEARLAELAEAVTRLRRRRCVQLDQPMHLDALADLLYERVSAHLRREMVVERERHGLLTFPA
ncbi:DUF4157 domain-containing protein [Streptomyces sp. NPDC048409]|uniref:eCIS core domain-containing protein n=1 Tax=Streptomyces sp. NPDC048409 TaxID=3154723 RepID=UPI00342C83E4